MDVALDTLLSVLPWLSLMLGLLLLIVLVVGLSLKLLDRRRLLNQKAVLLELTPPALTDKAPIATQHLFSVLHGLEATRSWQDKLLRRKVAFSLEVVSSREQGIRYIMRVAENDVSIFEQTIVSYLPDVRFKQVDDYLTDELSSRTLRILEFKQTGHFAYPLQTQSSLGQHDPIAYLTGSMTKLSPDELIAFQITASPTKVREADALSKRILNNEELLYSLGRHRLPILRTLTDGLNSFLFGILDGIGDVTTPTRTYRTHSSDSRRKQEVAMKIRPARTLTTFEQQLAESVHNKLSQPLFEVSIRAVVAMNDKQSETQRVKGLRSSLASFNIPKYQLLQIRRTFPRKLKERYRLFMFQHRLPALFVRNSCLLSASEVADIYHFPHTQTARTENVVKSLSRTLPAPISLKGKTDFDIVLGRNHHHGTTTDIGLTAAERERHVYIIGGTGNGKTTMMLYAIKQDLNNGKGLAVVDPHGDLAETILRHIPDERVNDVVYFNPDDLAHPIGVNLLELSPGLTGDELLREKDLVTESTISVFRKIFSDEDTGGHRIEYVLRNTVQTALTTEGATLFTVFKLLQNAKYRKKITATLEDEDLKDFWNNEIGKAGDFQRVKMSAGITAKIGRFLFSASAKRVLEQPKSTIDFDKIINSNKILICNFSKGLLGEDTSELFGITVLAKLQMAALRRARIEQGERRSFYLYVDEFQNFATASFVQMLSEARKYKLFLLMAEQSTSQQSDQQMVNVILANVGTVICFRSGNPADERLVLPLLSPYIELGEIANLPAYNFYARLSAIKSQEPLSGETIVLEGGSRSTADRVRGASRNNNAIQYQGERESNAISTRKAKTKKPQVTAKAALKIKQRKIPGR